MTAAPVTLTSSVTLGSNPTSNGVSTAEVSTTLASNNQTATAVANSVLTPVPPSDSLYCQNCGESTHDTSSHSRYKTKICKYSLSTKGCQLSASQCQFAHGTEDLRLRTPNETSRTSSTQRVVRPSELDDEDTHKSEATSLENKTVDDVVTIQQSAQSAGKTSKKSGGPNNHVSPLTQVSSTRDYKASKANQCHFIASGRCEYSLAGKPCQYRHGFCKQYSHGQICKTHDSKPCTFIHHRHSKADEKTWEIMRSQLIANPDDQKCRWCHKNPSWNMSPYCLNCAQIPGNKSRFCGGCDRYKWSPQICHYCEEKKHVANLNS
jgi:hypothetical protein